MVKVVNADSYVRIDGTGRVGKDGGVDVRDEMLKAVAQTTKVLDWNLSE